jgi:hypothetical protein
MTPSSYIETRILEHTKMLTDLFADPSAPSTSRRVVAASLIHLLRSYMGFSQVVDIAAVARPLSSSARKTHRAPAKKKVDGAAPSA